MDEQEKNKYILDVDGGGSTFRLKNLLLGGWAVFRVQTGFEQWFGPDLKPYEHFIPVQLENIEEDLPKKIQWAMEHDAEVERIAQNARRFAETELTEENASWYHLQALKLYAKWQLPTDDLQLDRPKDPFFRPFCCKDVLTTSHAPWIFALEKMCKEPQGSPQANAAGVGTAGACAGPGIAGSAGDPRPDPSWLSYQPGAPLPPVLPSLFGATTSPTPPASPIGFLGAGGSSTTPSPPLAGRAPGAPPLEVAASLAPLQVPQVPAPPPPAPGSVLLPAQVPSSQTAASVPQVEPGASITPVFTLAKTQSSKTQKAALARTTGSGGIFWFEHSEQAPEDDDDLSVRKKGTPGNGGGSEQQA